LPPAPATKDSDADTDAGLGRHAHAGGRHQLDGDCRTVCVRSRVVGARRQQGLQRTAVHEQQREAEDPVAGEGDSIGSATPNRSERFYRISEGQTVVFIKLSDPVATDTVVTTWEG
jgi:hypothetical protein